MTIVSWIRPTAFGGFFLLTLWGLSLLLRLIDERKGRSITAGRILIFPFFLPLDGLTERGRHLYARFGRVYIAMLIFWAIMVLTIFVP